MKKINFILIIWSLMGLLAAGFLAIGIKLAIQSFKNNGNPELLIIFFTVGLMVAIAVGKTKYDLKKMNKKDSSE